MGGYLAKGRGGGGMCVFGTEVGSCRLSGGLSMLSGIFEEVAIAEKVRKGGVVGCYLGKWMNGKEGGEMQWSFAGSVRRAWGKWYKLRKLGRWVWNVLGEWLVEKGEMLIDKWISGRMEKLMDSTKKEKPKRGRDLKELPQ